MKTDIEKMARLVAQDVIQYKNYKGESTLSFWTQYDQFPNRKFFLKLTVREDKEED